MAKKTLRSITRKITLKDNQKVWLSYIRRKWKDWIEQGKEAKDFSVTKDEVFGETTIGDTDSISDGGDWSNLTTRMRDLVMDAMEYMVVEPHDPDNPDSPTIYEHYINNGYDEEGVWRLLNTAIIDDWEFFPLWADPNWNTFRDGHPPYHIFGLHSFLEIRQKHRKGIVTRVKHEGEIQRELERVAPEALAEMKREVLDQNVDKVFKLLPIMECPICGESFRGEDNWEDHYKKEHRKEGELEE